jgi:crotonobetaine/carnitine-CoA ligase
MNALSWDGQSVVHGVLSADRSDIDDTQTLLRFTAGDSYTKQQLRARAQGLACQLQQQGVVRGDRVLIMLTNCIEFVDTLFACSYLGAIAYPVPIAFKGDVLTRAVRLTEPRAVVTEADFIAPLTEAGALREGRVLLGRDEAAADGLRRAAGRPALSLAQIAPSDPFIEAALAEEEADESTVFCIYCSSGTTGSAKGVILPHGAVLSMCRTSQTVMNFGADDIAFTCMPLYHANAFIVMFLTAALAGIPTIVSERFSARRYWNEIAGARVTKTSLMGSAAAILLATEEGRRPDHCLVLIAAVPRPADATLFEQTFGCRLSEFYGSTEAGLPLAVPHGERREGTCGRLLDEWEAELVDARGRPVTLGHVGELLIRPRVPWTTSAGYWGDPHATVEMWRNQWVHTGDLMAVDADGWYRYVDRVKDAIRVSGENVASADIELVVSQLGSVATVAAYGVPAEFGEQDLMVAVTSVTGEPIDLAGIREYCAERLPYFAVPRYVDQVAQMPVTPTGKIRKVELRTRGITPTTKDFGRLRRGGVRQPSPPIGESDMSKPSGNDLTTSRQPEPSRQSAPFWEGMRRGVLLLQTCTLDGHVQFPPSQVCKHCWRSADLTWQEASGRGTIYSYSVVHRPPSPDHGRAGPYAVALVDLEEGPRMMATVKGIEDENRDWCGQPVVFAATPQGLANFRLAHGTADA